MYSRVICLCSLIIRPREAHLDHQMEFKTSSVAEIWKNAEKGAGDLRIIPVTQTAMPTNI